MNISCQDNLVSLIDFLRQRGYSVSLQSENKRSDVYIYSVTQDGFMNFYNSITPTENGSLIINSNNKTNEQILYEIENRVYSPLF